MVTDQPESKFSSHSKLNKAVSKSLQSVSLDEDCQKLSTNLAHIHLLRGGSSWETYPKTVSVYV